MKIRKLHVLLLVAALAVPLAALAAFGRTGPEGHHPKRARLFLVLRMADALDLSDEKALEVDHVLEQAEAKRDELMKKRQALNDEIRDALAKPKPDDAKLSTLIDQAVALDRERMQAFEASFNSLKKVLTVEQQAKLVLLRAKMHGEAHRGMGGPHGGMGRWHRGGWSHHDEGPSSAPSPKNAPDEPNAEE
jgi:Spy/CpxP family protein refolding chaperone